MSYAHTKYEVIVVASGVLQTLADKGSWAPGYVNHYVRAVSVLVTVTTTGPSGVIKGDILQADGTTRGDGDGFVVTVPNLVAGKVVYKDNLNILLTPGMRLFTELTTATTAGSGQVTLYVEPSWSNPRNNTAMVASTT
jgi:hypothetical protein